mmetsp:Transcript_71236/g.214226  ORF Transcript_71236/g.214226 Transcript_71236/m.214226 type:complete len:248 (-) Transcript_71236:229-972(-)|eukprot:793909-Prymnesium_polylepis.1
MVLARPCRLRDKTRCDAEQMCGRAKLPSALKHRTRCERCEAELHAALGQHEAQVGRGICVVIQRQKVVVQLPAHHSEESASSSPQTNPRRARQRPNRGHRVDQNEPLSWVRLSFHEEGKVVCEHAPKGLANQSKFLAAAVKELAQQAPCPQIENVFEPGGRKVCKVATLQVWMKQSIHGILNVARELVATLRMSSEARHREKWHAAAGGSDAIQARADALIVEADRRGLKTARKIAARSRGLAACAR